MVLHSLLQTANKAPSKGCFSWSSPLAALTSARTVSLLRSISVCECACINQCMRMRVVYWVSSERYGISNISGLLAVGSRSRFALCLLCRAVFPLWEGGVEGD